jgi:hypothetical protein
MEATRWTITSHILWTLLIFSLGIDGIFGAESCSIENGPTPLLSAYTRETADLMTIIKTKSKNNCGNRRISPSATAKKTTALFDQAKLDFPSFSLIGVDFSVQILSVMKGESNTPALRDAAIFRKIEDSIISPTIQYLAQNCSLDDTNISIISNRIRLNTALETIYKQTLIWEAPSSFAWDYSIPDEYLELYREIVDNYDPQKTSSCKSGLWFDEIMSTILEKIQKKWFGIENSLGDWKISLQLLQWGKWMKDEAYNNTQRKLLIAELARQGFTYNAMQSMIERFDCIKKADTWEQDINQRVMNRFSCFRADNMVLLKILAKNAPPQAKTSDEYVDRILKIDKSTEDITDLWTFYNEIKMSLANGQSTNEEIISNLTRMHINLNIINVALEKRIPFMQKNCMKQIPSVEGWCRSPN